jgi:hypothetical protein
VAVSAELLMGPFGGLPEEGKMYGLFIQVSAMAYTVEVKVAVREGVFSE